MYIPGIIKLLEWMVSAILVAEMNAPGDGRNTYTEVSRAISRRELFGVVLCEGYTSHRHEADGWS